MLTLEPLVQAVRDGTEARGWELSGLQKTTSYQFEGRWEGDSTRSAYLFFHRPGDDGGPSVDVYLDETSRGLRGNLALVLDVPRLAELAPVENAMAILARAGSEGLPEDLRRPLTLRFRIGDVDDEPAGAASEVRFKVRLPGRALDEGADAVTEVARSVVASFEALLSDPRIRRLTGEAGSDEGEPG